jgi:opacity protein-like surface antigen
MIKQLIAAAALAGVAAVSHAAEPVSNTAATPFYAGLDMGSTKPDTSGGTRGSYGGFVGYTFAPNFAVEAGFRRLYTWDGWGGHEHANQTSLSVIGTIPITPSLGLYGRLGVNQVASHGSWTGDLGGGTNQTFSYSDRTTHGLGGIGLSYKLTDQISARVEAQHITRDMKNYSAGISYAF